MIPIFRPSYDEREARAVWAVLKSGWSGPNGPLVRDFEEKFARHVGAQYAIAVNNCSNALYVVLRCLGLGPDDEVILPTLTFIATAHAVTLCGATPVFCDVNEKSLLLNVWDASHRVTRFTRAIIPVCYAGQPFDMGLCNQHVVYDCAHATGSTMSGTGKTCCWSFGAVKNLACGGGMITTDDRTLYENARKVRWLGINKDTFSRIRGRYDWDYLVDDYSLNFQMDDIHASIGLAQLDKLTELQKRRKVLVDEYYNHLGPHLLHYNPDSSHHLIVLRHPNRDKLSAHLAESGITTGVHYRPLHLHPFYRSPGSHLPIAERVWTSLLTLPLFPDLTPDQVRFICQRVKEFIG